MIKFSSTNDFDFGVSPVQVVQAGFKSMIVKRAAAKDFLKVAKTKGQTDLHIIAVGAYEGTGFNRNGDCFRQHWCEKNAHYFKDSDRCVHRHHKNKPEDPKYGNVKAAAYNPEMKRIELVVGLDDDKCGDIIQEQEKVGHTNWSMASKQAYDICTLCKHKAATDDDRCEHIPSQIGEITKEGEMIGMDNPNPRWFEISYVRRPADRIGMSLSKVASDRSLRPMLTRDFLQVYTGFQEPEGLLISKLASDKRSIVSKLAEIEKHVDAVGKKIEPTKKLVATPKLASILADEYRKMDPARFFKLAADAGVIFSPENFCQYLFGDRIKEAAVEGMKSHLPDIFRMIEKAGTDVLHNEKYEPASIMLVSQSEKTAVTKIAYDYSLFPAYAKTRLINGNTEKVASAPSVKSAEAFDFELAKQYAAYKIAALNHLDQSNKLTDDLLFNVVLQNRS